MPNNSTIKKTMIAIIVFCVLTVCVLLFFFLSKNSSIVEMDNDITQDSSEKNSIEDDGIKEANRQAVQEAERQIVQPVRPIDDSDYFLGDLGAPVQLVVYSDFACPFCAGFSDTVERIKEEFGDKVVVAFRHFPLAMHSYAMAAAIASECAGEQGEFWQMHDKLFESNKEKLFNTEQFKKDAAGIGLNAAKFNQCLDTEKYKNKIQAQILEARNFGVSGAPANFVNGEPVPGAFPFADFVRPGGEAEEGMKSIIERHLKD